MKDKIVKWETLKFIYKKKECVYNSYIFLFFYFSLHTIKLDGALTV